MSNKIKILTTIDKIEEVTRLYFVKTIKSALQKTASRI